MTFVLSTGAMQMCIFGILPTPFDPLPLNVFTVEPAGNIMDIIPLFNNLPFGMCLTLTNPMVAAATAAALGVFIPMPCIPMTLFPRTPGAYNVLSDGLPLAIAESMGMCLWGGMLMPICPSQFETMAI